MAHPDEQPPEDSPAVRVIAMPADTNPYGDIFGGWLMSLMDSAAGSVAARYSHGRAVTIAVEGMSGLVLSTAIIPRGEQPRELTIPTHPRVTSINQLRRLDL